MGRHPLRLRLTLLYCLVSVVSSAVLLVIMYALTQSLNPDVARLEDPPPPDVPPLFPVPGGPVGEPVRGVEEISAGTIGPPLLALAIMAALSLVLGWLIAGRVLRPVLTMTERLHRISDRNVHERLSLPGPRNELKDLADTVDGLLGRLETALDAHKRFVANAAHELRTPLTVEHALLEEPLIDPSADLETFRSIFERLLVITDRRRQLLESLLTLAGSEHGRGPDETVDVAALVQQALRDRAPEARRRGIRVDSSVRPALVPGDELLVARMVANLVDNAIHHNVPGGTVEITVRRRVGRVVVSVANTGPVVPPDQVDRLFEPFQRLHRTADDGHHGLGLSIVRAIARAHDATVVALPRPEGGLEIEVAFPVLAADPVPVPPR
ncbi:sensor histidine kinase [Virgisporangium ochraceum]|uniref:histidine kinase n=1 Tax=Virgisporangium ochraceum TaxID=65505 RepID=A0A8J4A086_9ACTN|nr:HAMP domain-containing sensor histidine kinase [Virgisporangium ochraceum]GIJ73474.1 two-component sensor histidine kinase [Virgisporangium ochraceum]